MKEENPKNTEKTLEERERRKKTKQKNKNKTRISNHTNATHPELELTHPGITAVTDRCILLHYQNITATI